MLTVRTVVIEGILKVRAVQAIGSNTALRKR
jgi:hypothetical protein